MDIEARERACLELLQKLPIDDYVLIGGYATSSFDFPRFSVDLDIVIDKKKEKLFVKIILESRFALIETNVEPVRDIYGGRFLRFEKEYVKANVDLLINSVISRQTGSSYSFGYLLKHSEIREVVGFSGNLKVRARVTNREMLIALKANSMRLADKRDIIALCNGEINIDILMKHLKRCPREIILKHIEDLLKTLGNDRYKDSIKGVFRFSDSVYEKITERARKVFGHIRDSLKDS